MPSRAKGDSRKPEAVQRTILGKSAKDDETICPMLARKHLAVVGAEVKRADVLERSSCNQLGAFLETDNVVDREVAAKERQGDVTKVVCRQGTGA